MTAKETGFLRIPEEPTPPSGAHRLYAFPVGETNTGAPPDAAGAAATARANADARAKVLGWARRSIDLIPTPWLITGAGAVLLACTAAFGGLEAVPEEPIPEIAVGDTYSGSDLEITVLDVELRDEPGNAAIYPDEETGGRLLVMVVDVVNTFHSPRPSTSSADPSPTVEGIRISGLDEEAEVSRADDGLSYPTLQPDVPVRMLLAWRVGPDDFREGDEISITLPDSTHYAGQVLTSGDFWEDVRIGATMTARIEEAPAS